MKSIVKKIKNLKDQPSLSSTELGNFEGYKKELKDLINKTEPETEEDHKLFRSFIQELLDDNLDLTDNESIDYSKLEVGEAIEEIAIQRRRKDSLIQNLREIQKEKDEIKMKLKIISGKKEIEELEKKLQKEIEEESYYTDVNKDGTKTLRTEKYEKDMDDLQAQLKEATEPEKQKYLKKKINNLKMIKVQTKVQNTMVKLPKWIAKGGKYINEFSEGMGKMGNELASIGEMGGKYKDEDIGDFGYTPEKVFNKNKKDDYGFNPNSFFNKGKEKKKRKRKSKKSKSKKRKRKSKKKKQNGEFNYGW